jgi:hypothetical protein
MVSLKCFGERSQVGERHAQMQAESGMTINKIAFRFSGAQRGESDLALKGRLS